jgi:hypothetical protein
MISSIVIIAACAFIGMSFIFGIAKGFAYTFTAIATCVCLWLVAIAVLA